MNPTAANTNSRHQKLEQQVIISYLTGNHYDNGTQCNPFITIAISLKSAFVYKQKLHSRIETFAHPLFNDPTVRGISVRCYGI